MRRNGEQRLCQFPYRGDEEILNVLGGQHYGALLLPYPLHKVADVLHRRAVGEEQIELVYCRHRIALRQQDVGEVGKDIEQHGVLQALV